MSEGYCCDDSPARVHSTTCPMFQNLPQWQRSLDAPHSSLDDVALSIGPPLFRRPLPDASPWWCLAPKPLVVVVSACVPCDGSAIPPTDGWAQSARRSFCRDAARTWWGPWRNGLHGASVRRVVWVRHCLARGSQACNDSKIGCSLQDSPALVPATHNAITQPRFILYIRSPSPQAPRPSPKPLLEYSKTARK